MLVHDFLLLRQRAAVTKRFILLLFMWLNIACSSSVDQPPDQCAMMHVSTGKEVSQKQLLCNNGSRVACGLPEFRQRIRIAIVAILIC